MQAKAKKNKVLSVFSLVMINIIAVDSLRTLPISAEYGFSLVFYYILAAFIFFIPIALVAAELATAWPATGGIYVWVREAFGKRVGLLTIWLQWIYNVVWYPTILAFVASTMAYLFAPQLANDKTFLLCTILLVFWTATGINCLGMKASSITSIIGATLGTLMPMVCIITLGGVWLMLGKPSHINFTWNEFLPDLSHLDNLVLFSGVLFGLIGMEMSAVHAGDVENPQRDYPRALLYSTIIILGSLILGSLTIAIVIPQVKLSLVSGLIESFDVFFSVYHMSWMLPIVALLIIIGGFCGVSTWLIGPTRGLLIAAKDGSIPPLFSRCNRFNAPSNLLILQGLIFTVLCSVFVLMNSINESYWLLSALTAQLALLVYVFMFAAAIKLRYSHKDKKRAYKIPGGNAVMWLVSGVGLSTCVLVILLGFLPPSQIHIKNIYFYEAFLWSGMLFFVAVPWALSGRRLKKSTILR